MKMRSLKYDESAVKNLAAEIAEIISQAKLSSVELAFALAAVLRGLGRATYDRTDTSTEAVFAHYKKSPSWSGALILHADQIPIMWDLFVQERKDPTVNIEAWKAYEERL